MLDVLVDAFDCALLNSLKCFWFLDRSRIYLCRSHLFGESTEPSCNLHMQEQENERVSSWPSPQTQRTKLLWHMCLQLKWQEKATKIRVRSYFTALSVVCYANTSLKFALSKRKEILFLCSVPEHFASCIKISKYWDTTENRQAIMESSCNLELLHSGTSSLRI